MHSIIPLGTIDHRAQHGRVFGIRADDLRRHMHVLGRSGMGKTTLLEGVVAEAMARGLGCAVFDPHGDLVERLLDAVPRARTNDLVFLDGADLDRPIGWNPLAARSSAHLVASGVLAGFRKVFADSWGPRLDHVYRNTLLALLETRAPTLLGVTRMLSDEGYRASVIRQVRDPLVGAYWTREFSQYGASFLPEVVSPVQNKVSAALASTPLRLILGQRRSTLRPDEVLDRAQILLVRLAKGVMGEDAARLLGALLVAAFEQAAYARVRLPLASRHTFLLVADEFGAFVTPSFTTMLGEARKFGLSLVLAHQHLGQLDPELRAALLGNAGTRIVFAVGPEDAATLSAETAPELDAYDLMNLAPRQMVVRLAVGAETTRPFTALALPSRVLADPARAELLRRISRERYGRPRGEVEAAIRAQVLG
jgi:hypothetical protein